MARTPFTVEVLTPEGEVFNDEVEMLSTRTSVGSIGLLANHQPLLAILDPTELRLHKSDSDVVRMVQGEGYMQVQADGRVLILVDEAGDPSDIDEHERVGARHLQEALALREAEHLAARPVEPQLRRV